MNQRDDVLHVVLHLSHFFLHDFFFHGSPTTAAPAPSGLLLLLLWLVAPSNRCLHHLAIRAVVALLLFALLHFPFKLISVFSVQLYWQKEAMKLVSQAIREAGELIAHILVHAGVLPQFDDGGILQTDLTEGRPIGPERGRQHEGVPTIVLRSGDSVTVPEAIELLRVDRVHVKASLHKRFDDGPPWNLKRDTHVFRPALRQVNKPFDELPEGAPGVGHAPLCHQMPLGINDTDLVGLGRPIDADKPPVRLVVQWQRLPLSAMGERLDLPWCPVTPVQALRARLPTGRAPRPTSSRRKSPLGDSQRWGPLGALEEAAEDFSIGSPARLRGVLVPLPRMVQGVAIWVFPNRRW